MKNLIVRMASLVFSVLLFAGAAAGQNEQRVIHVKVPFEFTIGDRAFPAGDYSLLRAAPDRLDLRDSDAHVLTSMITHSVQSLDKSAATKLEFSTLAGGHALTQVWVENETIGYELAAPKDGSVVAKRRSHEPERSAAAGTK
jgi:hypothetical protein